MIEDMFNKKIEDSIKQLPHLSPNEDAWEKIESRLKFEEKLDNEIKELSIPKYKKTNWNDIEAKLNHKTKPKLKRLILYSLSAAASVALLIQVSFFLGERTNSEITYSTENIYEDEAFIPSSENSDDPLAYLKENCQVLPDVCKTESFIEQKELLDELMLEHQNLIIAIENYGESPELIKSLIKIENMKSEVIKDLLKMMNS